MLDRITVVFSYATAVVFNLKTQYVDIVVSQVNVGTKNVLLTTILYFQIHNK